MDGDGFGDPQTAVLNCAQLPGFVTNGDDCDDSDATINPAAQEIPNNRLDENCDGADNTTATFDINGVAVEIFPNPVTDKLQINTTLEGLDYKLYDLSGKLLSSGQILSGELDVSSYTTGVYFLTLQHKGTDKIISDKIIKL